MSQIKFIDLSIEIGMFGQTPPRPRPNYHLKPPQEPDTGPSSHNLYSHSPVFLRSEPRMHLMSFPQGSPSLYQEMYRTQLQRRKQRYMQSRQYTKAQSIDKRIRWAKSVLVETKGRELLIAQQQERRSISEAHQKQMHYLHNEWQRYFRQLSQRETLIIRSFQKDQIHVHAAAETVLQRRCRSLSVSSREVQKLKQQETLLRRQEDFVHLRIVKRMLAQEERRDRRRRMQKIARYAQLQEAQLRVTYSKKYAVLVSRLEEYRRDKERVYLREQRRLRQKYKNVMQQLRHDQTVEMQDTSHLFISPS